MSPFFALASRISMCIAICLLALGVLAAPSSTLLADDGIVNPIATSGYSCPCDPRCQDPPPDFCPDKTPPSCAGGGCNTPDATCVAMKEKCKCSCIKVDSGCNCR